MSFQENQSDSGDGFDGDGRAIVSPQHSLQHVPTQHEPHKLSTGIESDRTRKPQVTTLRMYDLLVMIAVIFLWNYLIYTLASSSPSFIVAT